ncbi:hypothetical protein BOX15_Mlig022868g4 [Macrostomum lignano]|uniref:Uncharacterized protein n=1 Tax=Macrostomum lignano TaxID=282301 RepID=A0A267GYP5_9PLAT|nr:hypothetical protein BOX15_Mlig022868g4 [Macrostomum lignano]
MRPRIRLSRSPIDGFRSRTCWLSVQPRRQRNQAVLATTKKIIKEAATAIQRLMRFQLGRRLQLSSSHPLHQHQQLPLPPLRRDLRNQPLPPPQPGRSPFRAASSSPSSRICQSRTTTGRSRPASRPTMRDFPAARPPELTKSLGFITAGRPPPGRCSPMDLPLTTCLTRQLAPRQLRQRGRRHRPTRWTTLPRNTKCRSGGPPDDRRRSIGRAPAVAVAAAAVSLPAPAEQLRVRRQQRPALPRPRFYPGGDGGPDGQGGAADCRRRAAACPLAAAGGSAIPAAAAADKRVAEANHRSGDAVCGPARRWRRRRSGGRAGAAAAPEAGKPACDCRRRLVNNVTAESGICRRSTAQNSNHGGYRFRRGRCDHADHASGGFQVVSGGRKPAGQRVRLRQARHISRRRDRRRRLRLPTEQRSGGQPHRGRAGLAGQPLGSSKTDACASSCCEALAS